MMYKHRIKNIVNNMLSKMLVEIDAFLEISCSHQRCYCLSHSVVRRSRVSALAPKRPYRHFSYGKFSHIASLGRQIAENGSADNLLTAPSDSREQADAVPCM